MAFDLSPFRDQARSTIQGIANIRPSAFEFTPASSAPVKEGYLRKVREASIVIWRATNSTTLSGELIESSKRAAPSLQSSPSQILQTLSAESEHGCLLARACVRNDSLTPVFIASSIANQIAVLSKSVMPITIQKPDVPMLVKALRTHSGMTQEQFAKEVGVTFSTINQWENGRRCPQPFLLKHLLDLQRKLTAQQKHARTPKPLR